MVRNVFVFFLFGFTVLFVKAGATVEFGISSGQAWVLVGTVCLLCYFISFWNELEAGHSLRAAFRLSIDLLIMGCAVPVSLALMEGSKWIWSLLA